MLFAMSVLPWVLRGAYCALLAKPFCKPAPEHGKDIRRCVILPVAQHTANSPPGWERAGRECRRREVATG
jgi:hypothetical protein